MGLADDARLVVKHTFLEFVESKAPRHRACTDTAFVGSSSVNSVGDQATQEWLGDLINEACVQTRNFSDNIAAVPNTPEHMYCADPVDIMPESHHIDLSWCSAYQGDVASYWEHGVNVQHDYWKTNLQSSCWTDQYMKQMAHAIASPSLSSTAIPSSDASSESDISVADEARTTVMLRSLPANFSREMMVELLNSMGFYGQYDFVYLPVNFSSGVGLGYAFVNLVSAASALRLWQCLDGFSQWTIHSDNVCVVDWSDPHQGIAAHVERYQNSPVMHVSVPDEWKPTIFVNGLRVAFPAPTKTLKAPKPQRPKRSEGASASIV